MPRKPKLLTVPRPDGVQMGPFRDEIERFIQELRAALAGNELTANQQQPARTLLTLAVGIRDAIAEGGAPADVAAELAYELGVQSKERNHEGRTGAVTPDTMRRLARARELRNKNKRLTLMQVAHRIANEEGNPQNVDAVAQVLKRARRSGQI